MPQPNFSQQPRGEQFEYCPLREDEDERNDRVGSEVFIVEPGQVRTCITEYAEEEQPDEGDVNHNLDEETAQERPDGRINLSLFWILAHDGFSTRHTPTEEGYIKEPTNVFVNQIIPPCMWNHRSSMHGRLRVR